MRLHRPALVVGVLFLVSLPAQAAPKYSIKTIADSAPPREVAEPIRKLLGNQCVQLLDGMGTTMLEVWFRKELPVKATETQVKNGLTYREVPLSTVVGAVRVPKTITDYRKQKIKPGVYTLRFAQQPMDGDHMGTAPYGEFCLICPAGDDKKPDLMDVKALNEMSGKATEGHPGCLVVFPGKGAAAEPKLDAKEEGHWVLLLKLDAKAGATKAKLDFGLTLVGVSASA